MEVAAPTVKEMFVASLSCATLYYTWETEGGVRLRIKLPRGRGIRHLTEHPHQVRYTYLSDVSSSCDPLILTFPWRSPRVSLLNQICTKETSWENPIDAGGNLCYEENLITVGGQGSMKFPRCLFPNELKQKKCTRSYMHRK